MNLNISLKNSSINIKPSPFDKEFILIIFEEISIKNERICNKNRIILN